MTHPATEAVLRWLNYDHLPYGSLRETSRLFYELAGELIDDRGLDGPEATAGLRKLLEAKDCFVRATVLKVEAA